MNPIKAIIQNIEGEAVLRLYEISDVYDHHHKVFYQTEIDEESAAMMLSYLKDVFDCISDWASMQFALKDTEMNKFLKGFGYRKPEQDEEEKRLIRIESELSRLAISLEALKGLLKKEGA